MTSDHLRTDELWRKLEQWKAREKLMKELFPAKVLDAASIKRDKLNYYQGLLANTTYQHPDNALLLEGLRKEVSQIENNLRPNRWVETLKFIAARFQPLRKAAKGTWKRLKKSFVSGLDAVATTFLGKRFMSAFKEGYRVFRQFSSKSEGRIAAVEDNKRPIEINKTEGKVIDPQKIVNACEKKEAGEKKNVFKKPSEKRKKPSGKYTTLKEQPMREFSVESSYLPSATERLDIRRNMERQKDGKLVETAVIASYYNTETNLRRQQYFDPGLKLNREDMHTLIIGKELMRINHWLKLDFTDADASGNYRLKEIPMEKLGSVSLLRLPLFNELTREALNDGERLSLEKRMEKGETVAAGLFTKEGLRTVNISFSPNGSGWDIRDGAGNIIPASNYLSQNIKSEVQELQKTVQMKTTINGMSVI